MARQVGVIVDNDFQSDNRVRREVKILREQGFRVHVLCYGYPDKTYPPFEGIEIHRIRIPRRLKDLLFLINNTLPVHDRLWTRFITRLIHANAIDVLHVHDLYMSQPAHRAIQRSGRTIPMILDLHENYPYAVQSYNWTKGWLRHFLSKPESWLEKEARYLKYADKIIVLSKYFSRSLQDKYDFIQENRICIYPNVIDFKRYEAFSVDPKVKRSPRVTLLYFGAVAERRGIFDTIEILKKCTKENIDVELLIIGPVDRADRSRFFKSIQQEEIRERITYIPWIKLSQLVTYMHISDICLSPIHKNPQHESGVANKIFQYMYGKKPIIASNCLPQEELIQAFNCGLIYTNAEEYFDSVKKLYANPELRKRLGNNGFLQLHARMDNRNYSNALVSIYRELL